MREIFFRGKRKDNGEWVIGKCIDINFREAYILYGWKDASVGLFNVDDIEVIPETICQYTGLTDKEGNKIFEGDILRVAYRPKDDCAVEWHDGSFRLRWVNEDRRAEYGFDYDAVCCVQNIVGKRKIVGNVFDNQEPVTDETRR